MALLVLRGRATKKDRFFAASLMGRYGVTYVSGRVMARFIFGKSSSNARVVDLDPKGFDQILISN